MRPREAGTVRTPVRVQRTGARRSRQATGRLSNESVARSAPVCRYVSRRGRPSPHARRVVAREGASRPGVALRLGAEWEQPPMSQEDVSRIEAALVGYFLDAKAALAAALS
ncbi:MAG: hypothetical protein ACXWNX_17910, partial [Isosphaeraceae bacterium]